MYILTIVVDRQHHHRLLQSFKVQIQIFFVVFLITSHFKYTDDDQQMYLGTLSQLSLGTQRCLFLLLTHLMPYILVLFKSILIYFSLKTTYLHLKE